MFQLPCVIPTTDTRGYLHIKRFQIIILPKERPRHPSKFFLKDEEIESKLKHVSFWLIQRHQLFLNTYCEFPVPQLRNSSCQRNTCSLG